MQLPRTYIFKTEIRKLNKSERRDKAKYAH